MQVKDEDLISLADAASRLPRRRGGKSVHSSTIYRWAKVGLKGVRLETISIGGTKCTSWEALQRFFDELSMVPNGVPHRRMPSAHDDKVSQKLRLRGYASPDDSKSTSIPKPPNVAG